MRWVATPRDLKNRNSFLNCDTRSAVIICLTLNQLSRLSRRRSPRELLLALSGIIVVELLLLVVILLLVVVEFLRLLLVELVALLLLVVVLLSLLLTEHLALALSVLLQVEVVLRLDVELALVLLCQPLLLLLEPLGRLLSVKGPRGYLSQLLLKVCQESADVLTQR